MLKKIKQLISKKWFKQITRLLLGIVAVYIIVNKVDLNKAWDYLTKANPWYLFLAFGAFFVSRWVAAYRINQLYKTQGLEIGSIMNVKLYFLAMFYNLFIPLVGGEGYKAIWINKRFKTPYKSLISSAFLDRLAGVALLACLALLFAMGSSLELGINKALYILAVVPVLIGHYFFMKWFFSSFLKAWKSIGLASLIIQLLQLVTTFFILLSLKQETALIDYLFIFLLSSFAFVLPMIGAREMAFVFGAESMGLDLELSLAISLLFYLCTALNSLLGSFYLIFPERIGFKEQEANNTPPPASDPLG